MMAILRTSERTAGPWEDMVNLELENGMASSLGGISRTADHVRPQRRYLVAANDAKTA